MTSANDPKDETSEEEKELDDAFKQGMDDALCLIIRGILTEFPVAQFERASASEIRFAKSREARK